MNSPETVPYIVPKNPAILRLESFLSPWGNTNDNSLITSLSFTMGELATRMRVPINEARKMLRKDPLTITVMSERYALQELSEISTPSQSMSLPDSVRTARIVGLNPKKILYDSRFESRVPGGGCVQKAGIRRDKVPGQIRTQSDEKQKWGFVPLGEATSKEPLIETRYPELRAYFRRVGGRNWIMGGNESLFCNAIEQAQQNKGNKMEIILWNCFSFCYTGTGVDTYPTATLLPFFDTAIAGYFKNRIAELVTIVNGYGKGRLTILVPTDEAFGDEAGIWNFSQSKIERTSVVEEAVSIFQNKIIPSIPETPTPIRVMRWDDFLKEQGVSTDQNDFSRQGYELLQKATPAILTDADKHAQLYFDQYGISINSTAEISKRQGRYLGMYAGEGIAYQLMQNLGTNLLVLNLEESRVPLMNSIGSNQSVPIIQGANPSEILTYYAWKKSIIKQRKL